MAIVVAMVCESVMPHVSRRMQREAKDTEADTEERPATVVLNAIKADQAQTGEPSLWPGTPTGLLQLGWIGAEARQQFEVGRTYLITIEPADQGGDDQGGDEFDLKESGKTTEEPAAPEAPPAAPEAGQPEPTEATPARGKGGRSGDKRSPPSPGA